MKDRRHVPFALLCSLLVHGVLGGFVLLTCLVYNSPRRLPTILDSAVVDHGPLALYLGSEPKVAPPLTPPHHEDDIPSEAEMQHVRVEPVRGSSGTAGTAPTVQGPATTGAATGGSGGTKSAAFFGAPIQARSVVYLIDRSLSMGVSGALATARAELLASLHHLPPGTRFQVLLYNRAASPLPIQGQWGLLTVTPDVIREVEERVQAIRGEGGTDHIQALQRGLGLQADVLFLVTDADELTLQQVQGITRLNAGKSAIHTIDLGTGRTFASSLRQLAADNRGTYRRRGNE